MLSRNSCCYTLSQPVFVSFATRTERPLLKLKRSILLVKYSWLKCFYCEIKRLNSSRTCLIGCSDFIPCHYFFMALGADTQTHTHTHTHTCMHTDICIKVISRNQACAWFKKRQMIICYEACFLQNVSP